MGRKVIEDKLSHDERLRLECLAQANAGLANPSFSASDDDTRKIIDRATAFEYFVKNGRKDEKGYTIATSQN